jgi:hypothetical protein
MRSNVRKNLSIRISTILAIACLFCVPSASAQVGSSTSPGATASSWKQVEDAMPSRPNAAW